jgi:tetratricopeptide (TPR) repeat protein
MTSRNYIFYIAILIGNIILVSEWAKYGLFESTIKNGRFMLGMMINVAAILIVSLLRGFQINQNAALVIVGVTIAVFFMVRRTLPPGRFEFNKASKRIIQWYPTHYSDGKTLEIGQMLKGFSMGQNTIKLLQTAIENMSKESTVTGRLDLALTHEWLGVLYRMMNEFEKAEKEFTADLDILEKLNSENAENRAVRDALGHVLYRFAELDHIRGRYQSALARYKKSLNIDESLGLELRANITRKLMQQITDKVSQKNT